MRRSILIVLLVFLSAGCHRKHPPINYSQELAPGQLALRKISPEQYPDFAANTSPELLRALDQSLAYLARPSSRQFFPYLDITHDRAVATCLALRELLAGGPTSQQLNAAIRERFEVYQSIGGADPDGGGYTDKVLFTGYFTPIYDASLTRGGPGGAFQYPLYKRPADLVSDPASGETIGRKTVEGAVVPYYTRAQIESAGGTGANSSPLAGQELVYLKSRWEAYVITVQGSARLRLTDGRTLEIGYAGHNGYEYTSPGKQMLADGVISKEQLSLRGLQAYFAAHPADMDKYLALNQRTVFFTERPGGPFGSLNVPVTPQATIATDKSVYPRALPAFVLIGSA
ncbi:MAG TPA: MltA domain-containing protein, partial [Tepidisphaeraceae bacterium]